MSCGFGGRRFRGILQTRPRIKQSDESSDLSESRSEFRKAKATGSQPNRTMSLNNASKIFSDSSETNIYELRIDDNIK